MMLVLTRKRGQSILIQNDIEIYISSMDGDSVKIGIKAPDNVVILRKELVEEVKANNIEATNTRLDPDFIKKIKL